jgi:DNA-binding FrmR family transcriptional regulator
MFVGMEHSYVAHGTKDKHLQRLKRIEGQVRGLHRMVDEEQYCIDILTQVSAVTRALESLSLALLDEHLEHCVVQAVGDEQQAKLKEASAAIARLVKS